MAAVDGTPHDCHNDYIDIKTNMWRHLYLSFNITRYFINASGAYSRNKGNILPETSLSFPQYLLTHAIWQNQMCEYFLDINKMVFEGKIIDDMIIREQCYQNYNAIPSLPCIVESCHKLYSGSYKCGIFYLNITENVSFRLTDFFILKLGAHIAQFVCI